MYNPEFVTRGSVLIINEGPYKIIGKVTDIIYDGL
jgi:GTPase